MTLKTKDVAQLFGIQPKTLLNALDRSEREPYVSLRKAELNLPGIRHKLFDRDRVLAALNVSPGQPQPNPQLIRPPLPTRESHKNLFAWPEEKVALPESEFARLVGLDITALQEERRAGRLPYSLLPLLVIVYTKDHLIEWLRRCQRNGKPPSK